jgi:hypothetical protein
MAIGNPDRCLVLRSNSVRAIQSCLSLCRYARLLPPELQQTDLFVANPANRKRTIRWAKHVSRDNGNRPVDCFKGESVMDNQEFSGLGKGS